MCDSQGPCCVSGDVCPDQLLGRERLEAVYWDDRYGDRYRYRDGYRHRDGYRNRDGNRNRDGYRNRDGNGYRDRYRHRNGESASFGQIRCGEGRGGSCEWGNDSAVCGWIVG